MNALFFWFFSGGMILCALAVILNRNAVASALCFTFTIVFMAGLFVMLSAFFLAAVQILVTAGAVMVLFLFIIMLLDMQGGQPWRPRVASLVAGVVAAALLITGLDLLAVRGRIADAAPVGHSVGSSLKLYAYQLFTTYLLPVQVMGFLLLVAMLGVVVLSRRMAEPEDPR